MCMRPQPGETICDPGRAARAASCSPPTTTSAEHPTLDRDQKQHLQLEALHGVELVDGVARLCAMNLLLHGIGPTSDEATPPIRDRRQPRGRPGRRASTWC